MHHVSVHEAKTHLSRLLKRVQTGEEIIITSSGKPVGKLSAPLITRRPPGDLKGKFSIPEDFDDPMPEEWFGTDDKFSP